MTFNTPEETGYLGANAGIERLAFLLSSWYSGATLLTMLLDRHPAVVSNGEGFPFHRRYQRFVCTCGNRLFDCNFYRHAAAHMQLEDKYDPAVFLREPVYNLPGPIRRYAMSPRFAGRARHVLMSLSSTYRTETKAFCDAHIEFMRRALQYSGATVYLDGTKCLRRVELLAQHLDVPKHFWLMVKDCRGYCASVVRARRWPKDRALLAAREWVDYLRFAKRLARANPAVPLRIIRYEDLCRHPSQILGDLFKELGLNDFDAETAGPSDPHLLGHKMRLSFDGRVEVREQWWRTYFDEDTQRSIVRFAKKPMQEFGYI